MPRKALKNKPLVETILEVKWALQSPAKGIQLDPHFKIFLGRLYDRVRDQYPEIEALPAAALLDELGGHVVQYRFRKGSNAWPLVQTGPGVVTLNETQAYTWEEFRPRSLALVEKLYDAHPKPTDLKIEHLMLRYIDAVEFDHTSGSVYEFLRDKMQVHVGLPDSLFVDTGVAPIPQNFSWESSFTCQAPKGRINVRFGIGESGSKPALLWETLVQSAGPDLPKMPDGFAGWLDAAHGITDDWFFKLIAGELEGRFSGE